jgi:deazaflavin-dependent oxidoreductase (nitroreductase family)
MRRLLLVVAALGAAAVAGAAWWRRNPRFGSEYVNRVVDPWLVRRGIVDRSGGEIGLLEHVGRRSGIVRVTPVHPVATERGFRIVVPLGRESHWAQNVMAAGHCRIQVGDVIHELDEPVLVAPSAVAGIPIGVARVMEWLGFRYLVLNRVAEHPGTLETPAAPAESNEPEAVLVG